MMKKKAIFSAIALAATMTATHAYAIELNGTVTANAIVNNKANALAPTNKPVVLMKINMTPKQKQMITQYKPKAMNAKLLALSDTLPSEVNLGMNEVPVLDQGQHGSCVTFANTAAVDALIGKGDYISQLCSLELGSYLQANSYMPSGWNGSWGEIVLNQMSIFGIINKDKQTTTSCAGVKEYPTNEPYNEGNPMPLSDYRALSENISMKIFMSPIINIFQRVGIDVGYNYDGEKILLNVKQALAGNKSLPDGIDGSRITFGVLLPINHCSVGACAKFKQSFDTWAVTDAIENDPNPDFGGHEMVITGYDDNAVAVDDAGKKHQGLLTLRNSWGNDVGDHGNYYMTYDFFKKFVMEAQQVTKADIFSDYAKKH